MNLDRFFYYPTDLIYESPEEHGLRYEDVFFDPADGTRLHGWFFPAIGASRGTVLHLHGNGGNVTGHFPNVAWLPPAGWNVLCFDYRGYGRSEGKVTRAGTIADAEAALDYLLSREDVDSERIVAFGQSLGAAVGIVAASKRTEIRGFAADGPFDHYRRVAMHNVHRNPLLFVIAWWIPRLMMSNDLNPIDYVAAIAPRPLFIFHGTQDHVCPVSMGRRLYEAAGDPKELWLIDGLRHCQAVHEVPEQAQPRLLRFFEQCVAREQIAVNSNPSEHAPRD